MSATALYECLATLPVPLDETTALEVRSLVWIFVGELKSEGWPPERVVVVLKALAREAGLTRSVIIGGISGRYGNGDKLLDELLKWSIERYYRDDESHATRA